MDYYIIEGALGAVEISKAILATKAASEITVTDVHACADTGTSSISSTYSDTSYTADVYCYEYGECYIQSGSYEEREAIKESQEPLIMKARLDDPGVSFTRSRLDLQRFLLKQPVQHRKNHKSMWRRKA